MKKLLIVGAGGFGRVQTGVVRGGVGARARLVVDHDGGGAAGDEDQGEEGRNVHFGTGVAPRNAPS